LLVCHGRPWRGGLIIEGVMLSAEEYNYTVI
jgi:hypothetical protein